MKNLIFIHIPKNGGNTFKRILEKNFDERTIFSVEVINHVTDNLNEFVDLPEEKKEEIRLLRGHIRFGLHEHFNQETEYVTFLRNPLERVLSFYNFVLERKNHRLYHEIHKMSFAEFVQNIKDDDVHNAQIRYLSGMNTDESTMLNQALKNIDRYFPVVGIMEQFDKSLILLKKHYHWRWPTYRILNKSNVKNKSKITIDNETKNLIEELNAGDYELYKLMNERLNDQFKNANSLFVKGELNLLKFNNLIINNKFYRFSGRLFKK